MALETKLENIQENAIIEDSIRDIFNKYSNDLDFQDGILHIIHVDYLRILQQ